MRKNQYIGVLFGRLTPVEELDKHVFPSGKTERRFRCSCQCGGETIALGTSLKSKYVRSCGCLKSEVSTERNTTHSMSRSPEYRTYRHMLNRCYNPNVERYPHYGGRGISVCDEWRGDGGFEAFLKHVGMRPSDEHSIDRIDTNGNYEPGNVRWATRQQQIRNRTTACKVMFRGEECSLADLCDASGIPYMRAYKALVMRGASADSFFGSHIPAVGTPDMRHHAQL